MATRSLRPEPRTISLLDLMALLAGAGLACRALLTQFGITPATKLVTPSWPSVVYAVNYLAYAALIAGSVIGLARQSLYRRWPHATEWLAVVTVMALTLVSWSPVVDSAYSRWAHLRYPYADLLVIRQVAAGVSLLAIALLLTAVVLMRRRLAPWILTLAVVTALAIWFLVPAHLAHLYLNRQVLAYQPAPSPWNPPRDFLWAIEDFVGVTASYLLPLGVALAAVVDQVVRDFRKLAWHEWCICLAVMLLSLAMFLELPLRSAPRWSNTSNDDVWVAIVGAAFMAIVGGLTFWWLRLALDWRARRRNPVDHLQQLAALQ